MKTNTLTQTETTILKGIEAQLIQMSKRFPGGNELWNELLHAADVVSKIANEN